MTWPSPTLYLYVKIYIYLSYTHVTQASWWVETLFRRKPSENYICFDSHNDSFEWGVNGHFISWLIIWNRINYSEINPVYRNQYVWSACNLLLVQHCTSTWAVWYSNTGCVIVSRKFLSVIRLNCWNKTNKKKYCRTYPSRWFQFRAKIIYKKYIPERNFVQNDQTYYRTVICWKSSVHYICGVVQLARYQNDVTEHLYGGLPFKNWGKVNTCIPCFHFIAGKMMSGFYISYWLKVSSCDVKCESSVYR